MSTCVFRVGLASFCLLSGAASAAQEGAGGPPEVPVARPALREVVDHEDFSGRTEATQAVELRARVSGYLLKAPFREGTEVKQGDVLFEIDPRPYRGELDRANATMALAEARLKLAEANHKRMAALLPRGAVAREDLDKAAAERAEAEAGVELARAGREVARLNFEFTQVRAPIAGLVGRRLVVPGNLVKADDTLLAALVTLEPMYVYFDIDERTLLRLRRSFPDGLKVEKVPVGIGLGDDNGFPLRGALDFLDIRVDAQTGTLRARAVLPNKDKLLLPGMFVRARLAVSPPGKALLVPDQAVMTEEGARFVFVVNDKDVLEKRPVTLGQEDDGWRVVKAGLKAEDRVVVGSLGKLRPGMAVRTRLQQVPVRRPENSPNGPASPAPPQSGRGAFGPGLLVETVYPGAGAAVVSDSVRFTVEQEVSSLERLRFMRSRCTHDGRYVLALAFARGADLQRAHVLVQNRVNLALPLLPDAVKQAGVSVKQGTAGALLVVNLFSPEDKFDRLYLGNYANIQIRDELARVAGVGEVTLIGHANSALRVWLDPDRLTARNLSAGEVSRLLAKEKGEIDPDKLANLILRADGEGRLVRLKDVGRVELGPGRHPSEALLDGKPSVALVVHPTGEVRPQELRAALEKRLADVRARLPEGLTLDAAFDFTAARQVTERQAVAEYLLLDLDLPVSASAEQAERTLSRADKLLRSLPGVEHVLSLSENPFDLFSGGPCILLRLTPAEQRKLDRHMVIDVIREGLAAALGATLRIRDLSDKDRLPRWRYPIDLALSGPEAARVRVWAREFGERLTRSKKLTDVWVNRDGDPRPQRTVEIDREKSAALGVSHADVLGTLQVYAGAQHVGDFIRFGRAWRVEVQAEAGLGGDWAKGLRQLKVRNSNGQMVPFSAFVKVRETAEPLALDFLDLRPMTQITANPAPGLSADQARRLCEALADEVRGDLGLSGAYRLTWLEQ
jgi:RND family efflux transporter MFP subunit